MKKHNYKLTEEDKQQIVVEYYLNRKKENIESICNRFDISTRTLYSLFSSKSGKQILDKHITESKKNFSKKLDLILNKAIEGLNNQLDIEDIKALDYAKILGITYDKSRLENNLSTENKSINININIEK